MIKVMLIAEAMLGGIRQHIFDIVRGLDKNKYEVYLVYSDKRADEIFFIEIEEIKKEVRVIKCNEMQREIGKDDVFAFQKIRKLILEIKPDIVHCHSSKAGIIGRLAAKTCGVRKIIYTPNAYAFQSPDISNGKKKFYILAEKILSRYFGDYTVNVSKGEMELAFKYKISKENKHILIYNGIADKDIPQKDILRNRLKLDRRKKYIGVTARCAQQKDPFTFLKIAEQVIKSHEEVEFLYIGDGNLEAEMKIWIKEHQLQNRIHMLGFRTDAEEIVGALDIYLSTALYEGLPYSMIEAMRAGVPIIATNTVGNNELVFEGTNGMMFPVRDVDKAVKLILNQLQSGLIKREDVAKTFKEEFSLNKMIIKLESLYCNSK